LYTNLCCKKPNSSNNTMLLQELGFLLNFSAIEEIRYGAGLYCLYECAQTK
jgi:hypothetical protein